MKIRLAVLKDVLQMTQIVLQNYSKKWQKLAEKEIKEMFGVNPFFGQQVKTF